MKKGIEPTENCLITLGKVGPMRLRRALKAEALARELVDVLGRVIPRYLVERLELDLDLVLEANGFAEKSQRGVLGDE